MLEVKECTRCHRELPLEQFSKDKNQSDGLCKICKECTREYKKKYYEKNSEKIKAKTSKYYRDNHEERLQQASDYRQRNAERIREYRNSHYDPIKRKAYAESHREQANATHRLWYAKTKDEHNQKQRERYATDEEYVIQTAIWRHKPDSIDRGLPADLTVEDWFEALDFFDHRCAYCGKEGTLEFDHVVPLSKGGGLTRKNIIPACKSCNSRKYTSDMEVWFRKQDYFTQDQLDKIKSWID